MDESVGPEMQAAAVRAAALVPDGAIVGLGTGVTVSHVRPPIPVELLKYGLAATLRALAPARVRRADLTPDGGVLADYFGPIDDPAAVAAWLSAIPGLIGHGLFAPELVDDIIVGRGGDVVHRTIAHDPEATAGP